MTRWGCLLVLGFFLAGCGGPMAPSTPTAVQFRLDANSCSFFGTQTLTFTFFVDGQQVGTGALGLNSTSASFFVRPGSHTASATVTNTSLRWENLNFSVASGQTFTYLLLC